MYYSVQHLMLNDRTAKLLFWGFFFFVGKLLVWLGFWLFGFFFLDIYLSLKNISYLDLIDTLGEEKAKLSVSY